MSEQKPDKTAPRDRSPSFPFISLKTAVSRLSEFEQKFGRQEVPADRAYLAWGMKGDTSQSQQTLAALKAFGLIEYKGTGPKRIVGMSEDARTYLRAQQDSVRKEVLKRVAMYPKWIAYFWPTWGATRGPDEICLDSLVLTHKFNQNSAPNFLSVYDDTIAFAGLAKSDTMPPVGSSGEEESGTDEESPLPQMPEIGDLVVVEINGVAPFPKPVRVRAVQGNWIFVEGSETGLTMDQVTLQSKGAPQPTPPIVQPPTLPLDSGASLAKSEREWLRGPLSKETSYRLIVSGVLGPKEIGKLIKMLEAQKAVLSDEDDDEDS